MPPVRPISWRARTAVLVCLGALALAGGAAGCGEIDAGSEPFAGTSRFQEPGGAYELRLLEPPWIPISIGGETIFVVPPNGVITLESRESDALYSLHVNPVGGDATSAMAAAAAAAGSPWSVAKQRSVRALSGVSGVEVGFQAGPGVFHREAFLGGPSVTTYHLHFTAKKAIADDGMITQMIVSFTPRGAPSGVLR